MILEWLVQLSTGLVGWVAGLFPEWDLPPELTSPDSMIQQLFSLGYGLSPWVDWGFIGVCAAIPLAVWVFGLLFRAARVFLGHVPQIGGNG